QFFYVPFCFPLLAVPFIEARVTFEVLANPTGECVQQPIVVVIDNSNPDRFSLASQFPQNSSLNLLGFGARSGVYSACQSGRIHPLSELPVSGQDYRACCQD